MQVLFLEYRSHQIHFWCEIHSKLKSKVPQEEEEDKIYMKYHNMNIDTQVLE